MQAFDDDIKEQQGNDHADIPDSIKQDDPDSEPLEELTPEEKEQLTQECEELRSEVHRAGYEDGVNDKPFNIEAVDSLISPIIKDILKNVDPANPDALAPEKVSQLIQCLEKICRDDYTAGFNEGGEERRQAAEQEKSQEQNKKDKEVAPIELDDETVEKVCRIFSGRSINDIIKKLNELKKDPQFKVAEENIKNNISKLKDLKESLTEFSQEKNKAMELGETELPSKEHRQIKMQIMGQNVANSIAKPFKRLSNRVENKFHAKEEEKMSQSEGGFKEYLEYIYKNKDLNAIRYIGESLQAFIEIVNNNKNTEWQVKSNGVTDEEELKEISEEINAKYDEYLPPEDNAFSAKNFNNMKGDRDAKIGAQVIAMNQKLAAEKKEYTKNLQNKYAQAMVDTWGPNGENLPDWAKEGIEKLKSKNPDKKQEEIFQIYALQLVKANWADEDDRNNYKNKKIDNKYNGKQIVSYLVRFFVGAFLLDPDSTIHLDDAPSTKEELTKEELLEICAETGKIFEDIRGNESSQDEAFATIKAYCLNTNIKATGSTIINSTTYEEFKKWLNTVSYLKNINDDNFLIKNIDSITRVFHDRGLTNLTKPEQICSSDIAIRYFNGPKFTHYLDQKFSNKQKIK